MEFVGIRNLPEKARLLREGTWTLQSFPVRDLAFDCFRHIEFLQAVRDGMPESEYRHTLYWKFLRYTGRDEQAVLQRCRRFVRLYRKVLETGLDDSRGLVSVTREGVRLDGSHRVAIASVLGWNTVRARVYSWAELYPKRRVRHILEECRVKREAQKRYVGKEVAHRDSGRVLGRVVLVSARTIARPFWFPGPRKRVIPLLLIEQTDGTLLSMEPERLVVRTPSLRPFA